MTFRLTTTLGKIALLGVLSLPMLSGSGLADKDAKEDEPAKEEPKENKEVVIPAGSLLELRLKTPLTVKK